MQCNDSWIIVACRNDGKPTMMVPQSYTEMIVQVWIPEHAHTLHSACAHINFRIAILLANSWHKKKKNGKKFHFVKNDSLKINK